MYLCGKGEMEKTWHSRYERWAAVYDEEHRIAGWSAKGLSRRLSLVLSVMAGTGLKMGSLVLDLGSGPGTYTRAIKNIGYSCFGLDYSQRVIEVARKKGPGEPYVHGEAYHLPFRNNVFNAVLCIGVLQSLEEPVRALSEISRILAPGGHLLLDGLSHLYWMHTLRRWREALKREKKRMSYYNPYEIKQEAEHMGFSAIRLHWLTAPEFLQPWFEAPCENSPVAARFAGYAFLLHGRKTVEDQLADSVGKYPSPLPAR
jgi:ubiquinone/menaquinone biosynthesis C-methylase UbiE